MKLLTLLTALFAASLTAQESEPAKPIDHRVVIEAPAPPPKPKLIYVSQLEAKARFNPETFVESAEVSFKVMQGEPERLSLEILGGAMVKSVTGEGLQGWALREEGEARFLDFIPSDLKAESLSVVVSLTRELAEVPGEYALSTFGPAGATGFSASYAVECDPLLTHRVTLAEGVLRLSTEEEGDRFSAAGLARLKARISRSAAAPAPAELRGVRLTGELIEGEASANFRLRATAYVTSTKPIALTVLQGRAAPMEALVTPDYRLKLTSTGYQLEFQKAGVFPIELQFVTPIRSEGELKHIQFMVPSSAVVPIEVAGISETAVFDASLPVSPIKSAQGHAGFLPANGNCHFAWQPDRKTGDGELFFTSEAMEDVSVGAGLVRQVSQITIKTLQGKLSELSMALEGSGEVLAVEGPDVLGWEVDEKRVLQIALSRPVTKEARFTIRSQAAVEELPAKIEPLRITPLGVVRHSGFFRVLNRGAVRIEVFNATGLTQLSPDQYPEALKLSPAIRQVFHYRYPAANRSFMVSADRVKPEIKLSQNLGYELTETDRVLRADLELVISEAGIRDWELLVPADYSVVSLTGSEVADYVVSEAEKGSRRLKVIFAKEVIGRHLVKVHLEQNVAAKAGAWVLPALRYPGSQVVSGELGVSAAPGYRVSPTKVDGLAEMPLARLLKRGPYLQQAFRIRGEDWSAEMAVTALSQNVQADTYHFYSLQEGKAYVSVLLNYFVTGAPVSEWRLTMPTGIEHLDVDGQDIRDFRMSEGNLIVPLHRPVMGAYQLLVTYEQDARSEFALGELTAQAVQAERGFIQVVSAGQVELPTIKGGEGLQSLDPLELPAEYQLMSNAPTLTAWQYQRRPFSLSAEVSWFERGETAKQVVEFAEIESRIARDGAVVTVSTFDVRTRDGQELTLKVPEGLVVRDVSVNDKQVTLRSAGGLFLVPLPDSVTPHLPVKVTVHCSQENGEASAPLQLLTPVLDETTQLTTSWKVIPDTGYQLRPESSEGLQLLSEFSTENGFTWIEQTALLSFALVVAAWLLGSVLMRIRAGVSMIGAAIVLFAAAGAFYLARQGAEQTVVYPEVLEYRAAVSAPSDLPSVVVSHLEEGQLQDSAGSTMLFLVGVIFAIAAFQWKAFRTWLLLGAGLAISSALLMRVGGAAWFFSLLGLLILILWLRGMRGCLETWRSLFEEDEDEEDLEVEPKVSGVVSALLIGFLIMFGTSRSNAESRFIPAGPAADSIVETWSIKDSRLTSEATIKLTGEAGDKFVLVHAPATLTQFAGEKLRVISEGGRYIVIPTEDGTFTATFSYQAPAAKVAADVPVLTGLAAVRKVTVNYEATGWSIRSKSAVRAKVLEGKGSRAQLWLAPEEGARVILSPRSRDVAAEETRFFVEVDDLYLPRPGVVDGRHRVRIRPAQGQVRQLAMTVAKGFTVSEVTSKAIGPWRFDPAKRLLTIELAPFQSQPFELQVETQRALAELPQEVKVAPLRVQNAAGEVGMLALAFGDEAQLDRAVPEGMSPINLADFSTSLLPKDRQGKVTATIQRVYRYAKGEASLTMKVAPVAPEVRVTTKQRLSFGEERTVLAVEMSVAISRAGIFKLSFPLPAGLEIESLTGPALSHWNEIEEQGTRVVMMNLSGKTIGAHAFSLVLTGTTPALPVENWKVPKFALREAGRQSGELIVVPGRGIQLSVEARKDLSAIDPRNVGATQPGSLAFRLLQKSWSLALGVDQLDPSVAAMILQDVELRESRSMSRVDLRFQVDHASIREIEVILPTLSELEAQTVRVSGAEVRDIANLEGQKWQIRFKRRVVGDVPVRLEYEQASAAAQVEPVQVPSARQQECYLALRPGALLRLQPIKAEGWDLVDWSTLPKALFQLDRSGAPAAFLRSLQPTNAVPVSLSRHSVVAGAKLRVIEGSLLTVLSSEGELINQAVLEIETLQRSSMTLSLPEGSRLFGVFVNEQNTLVVKDGDSYRFHVMADAGRAGQNRATVRFTYATASTDFQVDLAKLEAFTIGEPLENVSWTIALPHGYALADSEGDLDLKDTSEDEAITRLEYREMAQRRFAQQERTTVVRLDQASQFFKSGDQIAGNRALEQVYNIGNLDEASNEDVQIKLENVACQNAVIGLSTRRQRAYNDNFFAQGADFPIQSAGGDQIENAMRNNPVFTKGSLNFSIDDYNTIISANGAAENRIITAMASKWVRNQKVAQPVGQMIDPVIPVKGSSVVFSRMIHVDGDEALELTLELEEEGKSSSWGARLLVIALIVLSFLMALKLSRGGNSREENKS